MHGFGKRYAETFVLAHADKDIGQVVIGKDFIELDVPGEDDIMYAERFNIGGKPLVVALGVAAAHKKQPAFGVQVLLYQAKARMISSWCLCGATRPTKIRLTQSSR